MKVIRVYSFIMIALYFLVSCDTHDDDSTIGFHAGADTSASVAGLKGVWSIYRVSFENNMAEVPANYQNCGRDFFSFSDNGQYSEYVLQSSNCDYEINNLSWNLQKGVLNFTNALNQTDQWVITALNETELIFKARIDLEETGKLDVITLFAKRYQPPVLDMVSRTFTKNYEEDFQNLISYTWQPYQGVQEFVSYEIYRSIGQNCTKENAVLVTTLTDVSVSEFTDLLPPNEAYLCYYLKTTIKSGTLGESDLQTFDTSFLEALPVNLSQPELINNTLSLKWEASKTPYFSHYEIVYSNYPAGITGYGQQEIVVAKISDVSVTSFVDENLPYLEKPIYKIFVYDIFGHKSYTNGYGTTTAWEVDYKRPELLDIHKLFSFAIDPTEPIVYLYGYESTGSNAIKIHRYNYETHQTEAVSSLSPRTSTDLPIEIMTSAHGKELLLEQGNQLQVYDAKTLAHKYDLVPPNIFGLNDVLHTSSGFWVFTDNNFIYSYSRNGAHLTLVDKKNHFTAHQGMYKYSVFEIGNNQLILGHRYESNSIVYNMSANGMLTKNQTVALPIKEYGTRKTQHSAAGKYLINFDENRMYSTQNFSFLQSFQQPNFASGISKDGAQVFGSNNNPEWQISNDSDHKKEVVIFNRITTQVLKVRTKGYPQVVFEGYNGKILSISTGIKREGLGRNIDDRVDVFIEPVDVL